MYAAGSWRRWAEFRRCWSWYRWNRRQSRPRSKRSMCCTQWQTRVASTRSTFASASVSASSQSAWSDAATATHRRKKIPQRIFKKRSKTLNKKLALICSTSCIGLIPRLHDKGGSTSWLLAGRASSVFARRLLDAWWMSTWHLLDVCSMSARCLLDSVNGV